MFKGNTEDGPRRYGSMEDGRRRYVRLKAEDTTERKSVGNLCCASLHNKLGHQALAERQAKLHVAATTAPEEYAL